MAWGDFTGDGFLDRLRIDSVNWIFYVALGGPTGLNGETPWFNLGKTIDKLFVEHDYAANKDFVYLESGGVPELFAQDGNSLSFEPAVLPYGL